MNYNELIGKFFFVNGKYFEVIEVIEAVGVEFVTVSKYGDSYHKNEKWTYNQIDSLIVRNRMFEKIGMNKFVNYNNQAKKWIKYAVESPEAAGQMIYELLLEIELNELEGLSDG